MSSFDNLIGPEDLEDLTRGSRIADNMDLIHDIMNYLLEESPAFLYDYLFLFKDWDKIGPVPSLYVLSNRYTSPSNRLLSFKKE